MKEQEIKSSMNKSVEATQRNFNTIRTGRANASLLDRISVEYYGAETPIKSLATISTVDSQTISIQPFVPNGISFPSESLPHIQSPQSSNLDFPFGKPAQSAQAVLSPPQT